MRVAVVSPHAHNTGNTTLAMLIGMQLASNEKLTCIGHIKPTSPSFYAYLNFVGYQDKTSSPSQIVKILKEGAMLPDEARDYCKQITNDLEAFTNTSTNFEEGDMAYMTAYMASSFPHEHIVFDVDEENLNDAGVQEVMRLCDVIVLNLTQSVKDLAIFKEKRDKYMEAFGAKPLVVVVNKYNSIKGTIKEAAAMIGIKKPNNWLVLHDNPWITWATNHGEMPKLFQQMKANNKELMDIRADITSICITLGKAKQAARARKGSRR